MRDAPVRIGSRALDVLLALIQRRGQVVSKDTLMAEVWPDRVVEENSLQGQISILRKVLATDSDGVRYPQTVPGRGYLFVAPVEHESSAGGAIIEVNAQRDAPAGRAPLHSKPAIAVIPFINLSSDPQQEYFSDGITDDIVTELSRFSELHVIASNSSFKLKGRDIDVRQVGSQLGVS
ncbi:MAG: winged helix-turn-helix domain-containing protein [Hyphomicrobiaceae bacterium]